MSVAYCLLEEARAAKLRTNNKRAEPWKISALPDSGLNSMPTRSLKITSGPGCRRKDEPAPRIEHRQFVRLLEEELAFEMMTEEQRAADRLEEEIVSWLTAGEAGT